MGREMEVTLLISVQSVGEWQEVSLGREGGTQPGTLLGGQGLRFNQSPNKHLLTTLYAVH